MSLTPAGRNSLMSDAGMGGFWMGLHDGYPGTTQQNELATNQGSPVYGRKQGTFSAASDGVRSLSSPLQFDVYTGKTIRWITRNSAETGGTQLSVQPNGGSEKLFSVSGTDTILCPAHGYAANDKVVFYGDGVPTGLTAGQIYYVIGTPQTNTFQISASQGGSAITNISTQPGVKCRLSKLVEAAYSGQGVFTLNTFQEQVA